MKRILISFGLVLLLFSTAGWSTPQISAHGEEIFIPPFPQPFPPFTPSWQPAGPPESGTSNSSATNPLTGLPVLDPTTLFNPPALLSITNWPVSARPQAGLSYVSMVYELYIGDGESRFLSMFYGDYPPEIQTNPVSSGTGFNTNSAQNTAVGPIRSARLPYESLRQFYNGFLVMASGFRGVLNNMGDFNNYFGSDEGDINSAFVDVTALKKIANASEKKINTDALGVNLFDAIPPEGGLLATDFWFIYNAFNQAHWQYDQASQAYIRYQDQGDGQTFVAASDRLNGETLTFENVVILFADHRYCTQYAFDIDFDYIDRAPALLLRDGMLHKIYWTTKNTEYELTTGKLRPIRFIDENGDPFPMKPGQTWVHLVPYNTSYWEAPQSTSLYTLLNNMQPGSGFWVSRFYASLMVYDEEVCDRLR